MTRKTRFRRQLLPAVILVALLAGCGASPRGAEDSAAAPAPADAGPQAGAQADDPDTGPGAATDTSVATRTIVYTGEVMVRVDDVDDAAAQAVTFATQIGGFVGADRRTGGETTTEAVLQLRVPAERFTALIDQLTALGDQVSRDVKTEDVTEETVDLAARIDTQRTRVASGRKLLAGVTDRSEWLTMEREVAEREADLAALEAKQRRLADLVALSTVTATFVRTWQAPAEEREPGFADALGGSWDVLAASGRILLLVLGAILPWLLVIGLPVAALVLLRRRRRRDGGTGSGPGGEPAPAPAAALPPWPTGGGAAPGGTAPGGAAPGGTAGAAPGGKAGASPERLRGGE